MDFFLALFVLRAFRFLFTISHKHKIYPFQKTQFVLFSPAPLVLYSFSPLPFLFHLSPCRLRYIFLPVPFSLISPHVFDRPTVLALPPAPSLFSFRPIPVLSLLVLTSETCHHSFFSLTHSLPSLLYFDSLILSHLSYLSVSLFLYLTIHFLFVHLLAGSSFSSLLLLEIFLQFLLSLIPSKPLPVYLYFPVSYFHPFSSISLFSGQLS
jgi:hypothetical protein